MRDAEVKDPVAAVDLVVIGHVGVSMVQAGAASWASAGGSGYAVAASAPATGLRWIKRADHDPRWREFLQDPWLDYDAVRERLR